jgi:signal transduction histidine kinase/DNA-binding response OmpR family regulator
MPRYLTTSKGFLGKGSAGMKKWDKGTSNHPIKILLVEDNPGDVRLIQEMLAEVSNTSFELECADRLSTALERLAQANIEVILLDLGLQDSQGIETLVRIEAQAPNVPIVVLTGLGDEVIALEAVRQGAQDYLVKDQVDGNLLTRAIHHAIERKGVMEALSWESAVNVTLAELSKTLITSTSFQDISYLILEYAKHLTDSPLSFVGYVDSQTGDLVYPATTRNVWDSLPISGQDIGEAIITNTPLDIPGRPDTSPTDQPPIRRFLSAPALLHDTLVGQVAVANADRDYTEQDLVIIKRLATLYAVAIQRKQTEEVLEELNATLEERVRQRTFELETLYNLSRKLGYALNYDELFELILEHLYFVATYDVAAILMVTKRAVKVVIKPARPLAAATQTMFQERLLNAFTQITEKPLGQQPVQRHLLEAEIPDTSQSPLENLASYAHAPLVMAEETIGLLLVGAEQQEAFTEDHLRLLYTLAHQASLSIQRLQALLAAEQQRLASLVEHLPEGVVLLNAEKRVVLANPTGHKHLSVLAPKTTGGGVLTELGGRPLQELLFPSSSEIPTHQLEISIPIRQIFEIEAQPLSTDPQKGDWVLVIRDITRERVIQQQIQQHDRLAAVGQLAAGIAHDFNNLLTGIQGFAELIKMRASIPESAERYLNHILNQSQRAALLVKQILDFSRKSATQQRPLDLRPFLEETNNFLERTIPESINIVLDVEPGEFVVNADATQMQQILTNLAVNARDAMPAGGELHFSLSCFTLPSGQPPPCLEMPPGNWVILSVSDTGTGIPTETLPHIFEPFFTTKSVGQGTGLGLAQVYGLVKQHQGFVDVESEIGQGTKFTIYLPALSVDEKGEKTEVLQEMPTGHGETILLVEDETTVLEATKSLLEALNYQVLTANSGQQALEIFAAYRQEIALILTDMVMPGMNGSTLFQALQAKRAEVKVVMMTGYPQNEATETLLTQGVVNWMQKPVGIARLAEVVNQALNT